MWNAISPGFELVSPCPIPATITITPRAPLQLIDPHSYGHNSLSFPFSWAAQPWSPASLGHVPHLSIFSPTDLISNWLNFLSPGLYNNLTTTLLPGSVTISHSIQPVHGQGYILIFLDWMHLLFTQVHFLFWQLGRVGGQYATIQMISNFNNTSRINLEFVWNKPPQALGSMSMHTIWKYVL